MKIYTDTGHLAQQADEAWTAVLTAHGGAVPESLVRSSNGPYQVRVNALRDALAQSADFVRYDGDAKEVPTYPPRDVAEVLLARRGVADAISAGTMRLPDDEDTSLTALLSRRLPEEQYVIEDLLGAGHNGTLAGPYKAGKTSLACDLTRCLVDGQPFLGCFETRLEGNVGWFSAEMAQRDWRTYMEVLRIEETDRVHAWHLRGYRMPLMDDAAAERAVGWLREREVGFWVVDSHARMCAWSRVSENSNDDVAMLLARLDEIKAEAGVRDLLHICHFGRSVEAQHARGATVLDDWPDARWVQTKDDAGNRFLAVEGRGVELEPSHLERGSDHRLRRTGRSRAQVKNAELVGEVERIVTDRPGINKTQLIAAMSGDTNTKATTISTAILQGRVRVEAAGNSQLHYRGPRAQ